MAVMDEFREEREAVKQGTFKEKWRYFCYYYKWHVIIAAVAVALLSNLLYSILTAKDSGFYAAFLNCSAMEPADAFEEEFARYAEIDTAKYEITFDTNLFLTSSVMGGDTYAALQKLDLHAASGQLDIMAGGGKDFARFANGILFQDLRDILDERQLAKYEPYFYYVDFAFLERTDQLVDIEGNVIDFPDPKKPEDMERPVPVAIFIENSPKLSDSFYFRETENGLAVGIYANSQHQKEALAFLDYITE